MEDLILKEREVKEEIVRIINNSNLPAFILKSIMKETLEQILLLEQQQYQMAKKSKEEKIENNKKEGE